MDAFSCDTAVEPAGPGRWRATVTDRWNVPAGPPNGGYLLAIVARAMAAELPFSDPLTVTGHYLRPVSPGPATIEVEVVRTGRRHATAAARMLRDGREVLRALGTFTDLARADGPRHISATPPPLPPREQCAQLVGRERPDIPPFAQRFDWATPRELLGWREGRRSGQPQIGGWIRLTDTETWDPLALLLVADAFAPAVFQLEDLPIGWVPTIELTVHVRRRPVPGWLRAWFTTDVLLDGYLNEDGIIWDDADQPVAMSRQIALAPR